MLWYERRNKNINDLINSVNVNPTSNSKTFCRLGSLGQQEAYSLAKLLAVSELDFEVVIDSDGVRHTLAQHGVGKSARETLRGQIPIVAADFLALASWILTPTVMRDGQAKLGKQPRVELELVKATGTTIAIMEWRPGRKQLALVTMYKKRPVA